MALGGAELASCWTKRNIFLSISDKRQLDQSGENSENGKLAAWELQQIDEVDIPYTHKRPISRQIQTVCFTTK